jgi:hypothetical protein
MVRRVDGEVLVSNETTRLGKAEVLAPQTAPIGDVREVSKVNLVFLFFDDGRGDELVDDVPEFCHLMLVWYPSLLF